MEREDAFAETEFDMNEIVEGRNKLWGAKGHLVLSSPN